jgi:hypothetical protein
MDLETIEIALFAGLIPPPNFTSIEMGATNAVVVTRCHRKTVNNVDRAGIQFLPDFAQQAKQGQEQSSNPVQTPVETALFQHVWNVAIFLKMCSGFLHVPPKVKSRYDSGCHDFGIRHLALLIFVMMNSLQHIVTQAINCYNLAVHVILRFGFWFCTFYYTGFRMDYYFLSPLGGNLGYLS